jgi:hypothetical protein
MLFLELGMWEQSLLCPCYPFSDGISALSYYGESVRWPPNSVREPDLHPESDKRHFY